MTWEGIGVLICAGGLFLTIIRQLAAKLRKEGSDGAAIHELQTDVAELKRQMVHVRLNIAALDARTTKEET